MERFLTLDLENHRLRDSILRVESSKVRGEGRGGQDASRTKSGPVPSGSGDRNFTPPTANINIVVPTLKPSHMQPAIQHCPRYDHSPFFGLCPC
jgi:hypothetical protein